VNQAVLKLILQLQDSASAGLRNAQAAVQGLAGAAGPMLAGGLLAGTAALGAFGASSVQVAADFGSQMASVAAVSGATAEEMAALREAAISMGSSTVFSASEAGAALFELAAGGMNATQSIDALPGTLALAAAGGVELASAAEITAATLNGFQMAASDAGAVADKLSTISNISAAGVLDLGESMKYIAPVAAAMGVSIDDTGAALAVLANNGIKGSQAGTALRAIMLGLAAPSSAAAEAMSRLGIEVFDAQGKMLPFPQVIGAFQKGLTGLTQEQQAAAVATIVGREASGSLLALMAAGEGQLAEYSTQLANSGGAAEEMATKSQTAFDLMKGNVGGAIEQLQIAIGDLFIPVLVLLGNQFATVVASLMPVVAQLSTFATALSTSSDPMGMILAQIEQLLPGFGAFIAAIQPLVAVLQANLMPILVGVAGVVGAVLLTALASAAAAFFAVAAPIMALAAVIGALYAAWTTNFGGIQTVTMTVLTAIQAFIMTVLAGVLAFWSQWGATITAQAMVTWTAIYTTISALLAAIGTIITTVLAAIVGFWTQHGATIQALALNLWTLLTGVIQAAMTVIQGIINVVLGIITGDWETFSAGTAQIVTGLLDALSSIVTSGLQAVQNLFKVATETVRSVLLHFAGQTPGLGRDIINGIINGVQGGVGALVSAVRGAAQKALDAAKKALGIASPSKIFADEVGLNSIKGWVSGIEQATPSLEGALSKAAQASVDAANASAGLSAGGSVSTAAISGAMKEQGRRAVPSSGGLDGRNLNELLRGGTSSTSTVSAPITVNYNGAGGRDRAFEDRMKQVVDDRLKQVAVSSGIRKRATP
jgi:TP901 family phage tail tape measure protein